MENSSKWEELLYRYRYPALAILLGLILIGFGLLFFKKEMFEPSSKIEVLEGSTEGQAKGEITLEIAGSVVKPGVYKMPAGSRINDLLVLSGGFSENADRVWTDKYLNRAQVMTDGQKIYIPSLDYQSNVSGAKTTGGDQTISSDFSSDSNKLININNSTLKELDTLPGIGQTYGQNIIDHRPYSNLEELVSKGAIKQSLFEKIKDRVTVY